MANKQTKDSISALRSEGYVVLTSASAKKLTEQIQKIDQHADSARTALYEAGDLENKSVKTAIKSLDRATGASAKVLGALV